MAQFTIIIPIFNRSLAVKRSIDSVLNQTLTDFKCIIVDDCSSDDSIEVIRHMIKDDPRFSIIGHKANQGVGAARNTGIKASTTEFISFLDSDDYYDVNFLAEAKKYLDSKTVKPLLVLTGSVYFWDEDMQHIKKDPPWKVPPHLVGVAYPFFYSRTFGTGNGLILSREIFEKYGYFDERLRAAGDTDFFIRIEDASRVDRIDLPLIYINRTEGDHLSRNWKKLAEAYEIIIAKHKTYIESIESLRFLWYYKLMWLSYRANNLPAARRARKKLPLKLKSTVISTIYELFPKTTAIRLHNKIASRI